MPRYDYDCAACGRRSELIHGVHDDLPVACPLCGGGPLKKAFAPPTIHFKGSGWAKKERRAVTSSGSGRSSEPAETGETVAGGGDGAGKDAATPAAATADSTESAARTASGRAKPAAGKTDGERHPAKAAAAGPTSSD